MARITIDGKKIQVDDGTRILEAAEKAGIEIPTLCHHEDLTPAGTCGMCIVEIEGDPSYRRACMTPV